MSFARRVLHVAMVLVLVLFGSARLRAEDPCDRVQPQWPETSISFGPFGFVNVSRDGNTLTVTEDSLAEEHLAIRDAHDECGDVCVEAFDFSTLEDGDTSTVDVDADGHPVDEGTVTTKVKYRAGTRRYTHRKFFIITGCDNITVDQIVRRSAYREVELVDGKTRRTDVPPGANESSEPPSTDGWQLDASGRDITPAPANGTTAGIVSDAPGHILSPPDKDSQIKFMADTVKSLTDVYEWDFITYLRCDGNLVAIVTWGFIETIKRDHTSRTVTYDPYGPFIWCADSPDKDTQHFIKEAEKWLEKAKKAADKKKK